MRGDGGLYKRGQVWWMRYYRDGVAYSVSCRTTVKAEAQAKLRHEMKSVRGEEWVAPNKRKTPILALVRGSVLAYRTAGKREMAHDAQKRWLCHLSKFFRDVPAVALGTKQIQEYIAKRTQEGAKVATVNRELQVLRKAYKVALEHEPPKIAKMPRFKLPPEDNARMVFIDRELEEKLKQAAAKRGLWQRTLIEMGFLYGWRRGEMLQLKVSDVDLVEEVVRLGRTKNGDPREAPITKGLRVFLEALSVGRERDAALFPCPTLSAFYSEWKAICKLAGVPSGKKVDGGIVPHDMRRSSARAKRAAGVDTSITMELMGWRTEKMFRRYGIVDRADKLEALERQEANSYSSATVPTLSN